MKHTVADVKGMNTAETLTNLYSFYGHRVDYKYVKKTVDINLENKHFLEKVLSNHPNWIPEKRMIVQKTKVPRFVSHEGYVKFFYQLREELPSYREELRDMNWYLWDNMYQKDDLDKPTLTEYGADTINMHFPSLKVRAGQRITKIMYKFCVEYLHADKLVEGFNKKYSAFSDSMSPILQDRWLVISINPIDYATMSLGNSWASCHTIDRENRREIRGEHYHGMYCGGTQSYMMDGVSIVVYTVDINYDGEDYELQDKITRQMIHFDGIGRFVQGRLYPQCNDGGTGVYEAYRKFEQTALATCLGKDNSWRLSDSYYAIGNFVMTCDNSHHYPDYNHYDECCYCEIEGCDEEHSQIEIGHPTIDLMNGEELPYGHDFDGVLSCELICSHCGCVVDNPDDGHWIDGEFYCDDCCYYCDYCDEYEVGEPNVIHDGWSHYYCCDYGLRRLERNGDIAYCENCCDYYFTNGVEFGETEDGEYWCENCLENNGYEYDESEYVWRREKE